MIITLEQIRKLSIFLIILFLLLLYNIYSKLFFDWYGIDIIVRSYSFLFSFFCIFNYTQIDIEQYKTIYQKRYRSYANFLLFFETRLIPFLFIYFVSTLHSLIDTINKSNWPYAGYFGILDGRFTNIVFYSLILFIVLRYRLKPSLAIPIFIGASIAFYFLDKAVYDTIIAGWGLIIFKTIKVATITAVLLFEYFQLHILSIAAISLITGILLITGAMSTYIMLYYQAEEPKTKNEISIKLLRYGIHWKLDNLKESIITSLNYKDFTQYSTYLTFLGIPLDFTYDEWLRLLFTDTIEMSDDIALHLLQKEINIPFDSIIDYAYNASIIHNQKLQSAQHLAQLAARFADGKENTIIDLFEKGNMSFKIWAMNVMQHHNKMIYIPLLLPHCTDINETMSSTAYSTITKITGKNFSSQLNLPYNNPKVLRAIKDFYFQKNTIQ